MEKQTPKVFCKKKLFLKVSQYSQKSSCNFIKKKTPAHVLFFEYCEVFRNNYFENYLGTAASENQNASDKFTEGR